MTNEELKKKIVEILEEYNFETDDGEGWVLDTEEMADALIAAGIGDVKVLETALQIAACDSLDYTYDDFIELAEKELQRGMYRNKELEELEAENAALRERLEKALELPFFQKDGEVIVVIYKDKGGIVCVEKYLEDEFYEDMSGLEAAEARFKELKENNND